MKNPLGLVFACGLLGGCAAVPKPPIQDGIDVKTIVDAVQCELATVYHQRNGSYLRNWLARVTLELKVTNDAALGEPTASALPILSSGTLAIPVGPDIGDTSFRTANIVFDVHMRDLDPQKGTPPRNCNPAHSGLPQAESGLGLASWIATIADAAGRRDSAELYEAAYDLQFTLVRGVHGGLIYKAATIDVSAGSAFAKRTNNNHLNVVFQSDAPAAQLRAKAGRKAKAGSSISQQLDIQRQRFLPQQLIIQNQRGLLPQ